MPDFMSDLREFQSEQTLQTKIPDFNQDLATFRQSELPSMVDENLLTALAGAKKSQPQYDLDPSLEAGQSAVLSTPGSVTQEFGNRSAVERFSGGVNYGTDIAVPRGTKVAPPPGQWEVVEAFGDATAEGAGNAQAGINRGYGNSVLLRNAQTGEKLRFSHLTPGGVFVRPGQVVQGGQVFGLTGATGNTAGQTGQHLDLEYYDQGGKVSNVRNTPYWNSLFGESGGGNPFGNYLRDLGITVKEGVGGLGKSVKETGRQITERAGDIYEGFGAKREAQANLDEAIKERLKSRETNKYMDAEMGTTSIPRSELNDDEKKYLANQSVVVLPGTSMKQVSGSGAGFARALSQAKRGTAIERSRALDTLDDIVREQATPAELKKYGDKVGVAIQDDSFTKLIARRIYNQGEVSRTQALKALRDKKLGKTDAQPTKGDMGGERVYHATNEYAKELIEDSGFKLGYESDTPLGAKNKSLGEGVYFGSSKDRVKQYGDSVVEATIKPGVNIKNFTRQEYADYVNKNNLDLTNPQSITDHFRKKGIDGIRTEREIVVFEPKNVSVVSPSLPQPTKVINEVLKKANK